MASNIKGITVEIGGNTQPLQKALEDVERKGKSLQSELNTINRLLKFDPEHSVLLAQKQKVLADSIENTRKKLETLKEAQEQARRQLANGEIGEEQYRALERQVIQTSQSLDKLEQEARDLVNPLDRAGDAAEDTADDLEDVGDAAEEAGDDAQGFGKNLKDAFLQAAGVAGGIALVDIIRGIGKAFVDCAKQAIEFESAMAGVAKTTNMSQPELSEMGEAIKRLSTEIPIAQTELAGIAETAGQLGIAKDKIIPFTETMAKLGTATNLTSEEAATMIAQFANVTGLDTNKYENLGSAIVHLGNNSATTESKILDMSQRVASAASVAGFSATDILGFAAATSSLGIESEAGGSALSKLISKIQLAVETGKGLDDFAKISGMSAQDFKKAWGEDAAGATAAFIKGLNDTERNGNTAIAVLDDMGLSEVRLRNAVLSLSEAGDLLTDSIEMSNSAFEANTALSAEAETRYETTESRIQILKNTFANLQIEMGEKLLPVIVGVAEAFAAFAQAIMDNGDVILAVITSIAAGFAAWAIASNIQNIITLFKNFGAAVAEQGKNIIAAIRNIDKASMGTIIGAITAVIVLCVQLADAFLGASKEAREFKDEAEGLNDTAQSLKSDFDGTSAALAVNAEKARSLVGEIQALDTAIKGGNLSATEMAVKQAELKTKVIEYNAAVGEEALKINEATGAIDGNTSSLASNTEALIENAKRAAEQEALTKAFQTQSEAFAQTTSGLAKIKQHYDELSPAQQAIIDNMEKEGVTREKLSELWWESSNVFSQTNNEVRTFIEGMENSVDAEIAAGEQADALAEQMKKNAVVQQETTKTVEEKTEAVRELTDVEALQLMRLKEHGQELGAELEAQLQAYKENNAGIYAEYEELIRKEEEFQNKRLEVIQNGNEKIELNYEISLEKRIENMQANQALFDKYESNIAVIRESANSKMNSAEKQAMLLYLETLTDGSTQSMAIVDQMANDIAESGGNAAYRLAAQYYQTLSSERQNMETISFDLGKGIVDSTAKGVASNPAIGAEATAQIQNTSNLVDSQIQDPTAFYADGIEIIKRLADGIAANPKMAEQSALQLTATINELRSNIENPDSFYANGLKVIERIADGIAAKPDMKDMSIKQLQVAVHELDSQIKDRSTFYSLGENAISRMSEGVESNPSLKEETSTQLKDTVNQADSQIKDRSSFYSEGIAIIQRLADGIANNPAMADKSATQLKNTVADLRSKINDPNSFYANGLKVIENLANGIAANPGMREKSLKQLQTAINDLDSKVKDKGTFYTLGTTAVNLMANGIEQTPNMKKQAGSQMDGALSTMKSQLGQVGPFYNTGADIVQRLADGMKATQDRLIVVCSSLINRIRNEFLNADIQLKRPDLDNWANEILWKCDSVVSSIKNKFNFRITIPVVEQKVSSSRMARTADYKNDSSFNDALQSQSEATIQAIGALAELKIHYEEVELACKKLTASMESEAQAQMHLTDSWRGSMESFNQPYSQIMAQSLDSLSLIKSEYETFNLAKQQSIEIADNEISAFNSLSSVWRQFIGALQSEANVRQTLNASRQQTVMFADKENSALNALSAVWQGLMAVFNKIVNSVKLLISGFAEFLAIEDRTANQSRAITMQIHEQTMAHERAAFAIQKHAAAAQMLSASQSLKSSKLTEIDYSPLRAVSRIGDIIQNALSNSKNNAAQEKIVYLTPQITINAQKLTDAEMQRAVRFVSREFAKATGGMM